MPTIRKTASPGSAQVVGICLFLVLAVIAVFGQTAWFDFVDYDDRENVFANPVVAQGLSFRAVGWAFTHAQTFNWVPLTTLSHMLDCDIFGLNASGHHLVNVALHAAAAVLLFLVLRQLTGCLWRSAFVAALFAVHPLRAESVAWISERKDVLSAVFFLLAIEAYVAQVRRPSRLGAWMLCLLFALGLLAKSMVATLPLILLLLDYWPLGRLHHARDLPGLVREKIPLLVLSAASCFSAVLVPGLLVAPAQQPSLLARMSNAVVSYAVYLGQMFFPWGLATPYGKTLDSQPAGKLCLALLLLAAITSAVVLTRKKRPYLLTGWLWYLGMLLPVIGIIQISTAAAHADRYTYLPQIGLAIALVWAVADWSAAWKFRRAALGGAMIAVIAALACCARAQTAHWKDSQSLWQRALDCTTNNFVALNNMGTLLVRQGRFDEAIQRFQASLEIEPRNAEAINNLGNVFAMKKDNDAATAQYQRALQLRPDYVSAHYNLGNVLVIRGLLDEAIAHFQKVLELAPGDANGQNALGNALLLKGDFDGALACFWKTANAGPDPPSSWRSMGDDFLQKEEFDAAILCYLQVVKIAPRFADTYANLGIAYLRKGQSSEAMECWQRGLEIAPNQLQALNYLAMAMAMTPDPALRNGAKAVALATQASQLTGGSNPRILHTLAAAYAADGNFKLAVTTAQRALQLASAQKDGPMSETLNREIKLYQANTPLRAVPR